MSRIEIVNRALIKLGEPPVSSLNDAAFGRSYEMVYEDMRRLLLSLYPWRFAVRTGQVARCEQKDASAFCYQLPRDLLLLLQVYGTETPEFCDIRNESMTGYKVAGDKLLIPFEGVFLIEYVADVSDESKFSQLFREALAAKTAAELAVRIKHSFNVKQLMDNEFAAYIRQAELNNEIAKDIETLKDSSWIRVREAWR